jgi:hypothetical protein
MKKWIGLYPVTFGLLIAVLIGAIIISIDVWLPRIGKSLGGHNPIVQAIWFTIVLFIVTMVRLWRFRLRDAFSFWASLLVLWTLHVVGALAYFFYFGPLMLRQWVYILVCEAFVFVFVVDWTTRRFGHSRRHQYH